MLSFSFIDIIAVKVFIKITNLLKAEAFTKIVKKLRR